MTRRRKTKAERDQEWDDADRRVWERFRPRLESLRTFAEAVVLVNEAPRPDAPGRKYYSNLGFFLGDFSVPLGSSHTERELYLAFIQRLDEANALKPEARKRIEEAFRSAM